MGLVTRPLRTFADMFTEGSSGPLFPRSPSVCTKGLRLTTRLLSHSYVTWDEVGVEFGRGRRPQTDDVSTRGTIEVLNTEIRRRQGEGRRFGHGGRKWRVTSRRKRSLKRDW